MKIDQHTEKIYKVALGKKADGDYRAVPSVGIAQFYRVTGATTIAATLAPDVAWQLESVRIHLSAAGGAANLTATLDHHTGSAYDLVILTQDMTSVTDFVWHCERPMEFEAQDELDFAWANGSSRTYGLEVIWKPR